MKTMIHIKFVKEGIHCYPEAGTEECLADVAHLQHPHFHYFYFEVETEVGHDNREIEFIQFRRWCESLYNEHTLSLNAKSCEMIAKDLIYAIKANYGKRFIRVRVLEDNINGAIVEYDPLDEE